MDYFFFQHVECLFGFRVAVSASGQRGENFLPVFGIGDILAGCGLPRRFERAGEHIVLIDGGQRFVDGFAVHALAAKLHADAARAHALIRAGSGPLFGEIRIVDVSGFVQPRHHAGHGALWIGVFAQRVGDFLLGSRTHGQQRDGLFHRKRIGAFRQKRVECVSVKRRSAAVRALFEHGARHGERFAV